MNFTPLHIAARDGKIEMIQLLLSEGADQMIRDSNQQCPIKLAVLSEQIEALQILIRYGQFWSFFFYSKNKRLQLGFPLTVKSKANS